MYITHPDTPAFFVDYHNLRKEKTQLIYRLI